MAQKIIAVLILAAALQAGAVRAQDSWEARGVSAKSTDLKDAAFGRDAFYIATKSSLYRAGDIKEKWEHVFSIPQGGSNEITCVAGRPNTIFVGTRRGLFRSDDRGQAWKNVFRTILPDKNHITYIELSKHNRSKVLIATGKGVFISYDLGASWQDTSGALKNTPVACLALNKETMYAGTASGLYARKESDADWERIIVRSGAEKSAYEEPPEEAAEDSCEKDASVRAVAVDGARVYAAYYRRILCSDDYGKTWNDLPSEGLRGEVNYMLVSAKNKKVYCATDKGVFESGEGKARWMELYKGMSKTADVSRLLFSDESENELYAVTDKGLFSLLGGDYLADKYPDIEKSLNTLRVTFDGEPTYKELQQAAIRFCDVSPEKIKKWHAGSKAKALLPRISVGFDDNRSDNYEIYTSATTHYAMQGPDDTSNGWDIGLSWDIGNLIWSDDQTNIDVRSRLTTQLRNDILDDLRRAYYERKRIQFELMTNPPRDMKLRFEKELRLQELTQAIDDLTGNYLSEHLKKK